MEIIDITKELFSSPLYPGTKSPRMKKISDIENDGCEVSEINIDMHTGTHIDAPRHFIRGAEDITEIPLSVLCGECFLISCRGIAHAGFLKEKVPEGTIRLLIRGGYIDAEAAKYLTDIGIRLIGCDQISIACGKDENHTHTVLLSRGAVIIENLYLDNAEDGAYTIYALPLKAKGAEGAPARVILTRE